MSGVSDPRPGSDALTRTVVGANELNRLSVNKDGRLYWDDKPVIVRRRLVLTPWQKLGAIFIGIAAVMIGLSALVQTTIAAHEWMCGAKWLTGSCPGAAPSVPPPPPRPQFPEIPT